MSNSNSFKLEKCLTKLENKAYDLKYGTCKSLIPGVVSNSTEKSYRKLNNVGKTLTLLLFRLHICKGDSEVIYKLSVAFIFVVAVYITITIVL